jgi:hypothetical protein
VITEDGLTLDIFIHGSGNPDEEDSKQDEAKVVVKEEVLEAMQEEIAIVREPEVVEIPDTSEEEEEDEDDSESESEYKDFYECGMTQVVKQVADAAPFQIPPC